MTAFLFILAVVLACGILFAICYPTEKNYYSSLKISIIILLTLCEIPIFVLLKTNSNNEYIEKVNTPIKGIRNDCKLKEYNGTDLVNIR